MIFWQKEKTLQCIFYSVFFTSSSLTPNCQTLCENTSNFKCAKMRLHPKTYCSNLLVGEIWRDSWSNCCLSHYKWIPSFCQMSKTRQGKTPASPHCAKLLWIFPSLPFSPRSCLGLKGSMTQLFINAENHPYLVYQQEHAPLDHAPTRVLPGLCIIQKIKQRVCTHTWAGQCMKLLSNSELIERRKAM